MANLQAGMMAMRPLHSSPRLCELMQRSPLPTILGSPSRVSSCFGHRIKYKTYACVCRKLRYPANGFNQSIPLSIVFILYFGCVLPLTLTSCLQAIPPFEFPKPPSSPNLVTFLAQQGLVLAPPGSRTASDHRDPGQPPTGQLGQYSHRTAEDKSFGRSQSAGRLSDMLLMAAFGGPLGERDSSENLGSNRGAIDITGGLSRPVYQVLRFSR